MERLRLLLPARLRDRTITYVVLAALWPFVPASLCMAFFAVYDQIRHGMLSVALYFSVLVPSIVASVLGSAVILLALPIRYWARITVSVTGGIAAFFAFGLWQAVVMALLVLMNLLRS